VFKDILIDIAYGLYNLTARPLEPSVVLPSDPMGALNAYFDQVWVLTIPRNTKRQEYIRRELSGLRFDFFTGVDGAGIADDDPRILPSEAEARYGRPLKKNEFACTLSHLEMFKAMVERGVRRALIFEDDAAFLKSRGKWIPYCLSRLPADWELFYLGYRDGELRGFLRGWQERLGRPRDEAEVVSRPVGRGIRTAAGHDFTHAYAITLEGARKILDGVYPTPFTADGLLEEKVLSRKIRAYISVPKIFVQLEELGSSIHSG